MQVEWIMLLSREKSRFLIVLWCLILLLLTFIFSLPWFQFRRYILPSWSPIAKVVSSGESLTTLIYFLLTTWTTRGLNLLSNTIILPSLHPTTISPLLAAQIELPLQLFGRNFYPGFGTLGLSFSVMSRLRQSTCYFLLISQALSVPSSLQVK